MVPVPSKSKLSDKATRLGELMAKLTFEDYWMHQVLKYPTLYANIDVDTSKLLLLDQILNVNGNGLQSNRDAVESYLSSLLFLEDPENLAEVKLRFSELLQTNDLQVANGYSQAQMDSHEQFKLRFSATSRAVSAYPVDIPLVSIGLRTYQRLESAGMLPPAIAVWEFTPVAGNQSIRKSLEKRDLRVYGQIPRYPLITPYPNFRKEYSSLFCAPLVLKLFLANTSWWNAVEFYYQYALNFFEDDDQAVFYEYAYIPHQHPVGVVKAKALEQDFLSAFAQYSSNEEISQAYEQEYTGDISAFLTERWRKDKLKIVNFIESVLSTQSSM